MNIKEYENKRENEYILYHIKIMAMQMAQAHKKKHGIKYTICDRCNAKDCVIHNHHPNYYEPLFTIPLCIKCHKYIHRLENNTTVYIESHDIDKVKPKNNLQFKKLHYEELLRLCPKKSSYGKHIK